MKGWAEGRKLIAYFFLELKAFPFVLILQFIVLHLYALESLNAALNLHWEALDVPRAPSHKASELALHKTEHSGVSTGWESTPGRLLILWLLALRDIRDSRTRETLGDGSVCERGVLGCWGRRVEVADRN